MRVLFLSQIVPYPPHGGVLQRGYNLLRELGRTCRVHLLAFVHPDVLATPEAIRESQQALQLFCEKVEYFPLWPKSSRVHRLAALAASAASTVPFSVIAHRSSAFRQRVAQACASDAFDVVHVDTLALSQFLPANRRLPAVLTHHNIESVLMERRSDVEPGRLTRAFLRREAAKLSSYEMAVVSNFDVNIVVSTLDEQTLRGRLPGLQTAVVPNGVDGEYFRPNPEQETPALIYTGGMNMFANRDAVLFFLDEVWPLVSREMPDLTFYAVGQDPPHELRMFARRDARIVVTGYVPDVRPFSWASSVYVVPLRVGGGTRLKVLDAMAMGKALVSTSIGCEGIDVTPGRHLLVADSPSTFAEAVLHLLKDHDKRRALGRAARELVESRYSWAVIGGTLREAYRQAILVRGGHV